MSCTFFFFFNDTATTEIYTLSLHDALPISDGGVRHRAAARRRGGAATRQLTPVRYKKKRPMTAGQARALGRTTLAKAGEDRKSTRLNSSHVRISYAVFCFEKKKSRTSVNTC